MGFGEDLKWCKNMNYEEDGKKGGNLKNALFTFPPAVDMFPFSSKSRSLSFLVL